VVRHLLPHQAALRGEYWSPEHTEAVIQLASTIPMTLHLMPIEVAANAIPTGPVGGWIPRTFSITFTPSSEADPDSFYFRFPSPPPNNQFYVYPATPSIPLEIELAQPIHAGQLHNIQIVFTGGGYATNIQGEVGSGHLTCTIPGSAESGDFVVFNAATSQPIPVAGPNGAVLGNILKRVYLD
jgi:hypothetical protein